MKVILPGGSGQVGAVLARAFHAAGDEVVVLSRSPAPAPWRTVAWDAATVGPWAAELDGADVVINLAGRSVNCRYTPANRRAITASRVDSARAVGRAIGQRARPPPSWLQAATATIYDHRRDADNDDVTGAIGGPAAAGAPDTWRFSLGVARAWEAAAAEACPAGTRLVLLRSAMTMSPDPGGVFDVLLGLVRHGLGGTTGDGRQFVSWIHDDDFVRAVRFLIDRGDLAGPVNLSSPRPLPNAEFMRDLRAVWGARVGLPGGRVGAVGRGDADANRDRAGAQEPAGDAAPPRRGGVHVRLPGLGDRGGQLVFPVARRAARADVTRPARLSGWGHVPPTRRSGRPGPGGSLRSHPAQRADQVVDGVDAVEHGRAAVGGGVGGVDGRERDRAERVERVQQRLADGVGVGHVGLEHHGAVADCTAETTRASCRAVASRQWQVLHQVAVKSITTGWPAAVASASAWGEYGCHAYGQRVSRSTATARPTP